MNCDYVFIVSNKHLQEVLMDLRSFPLDYEVMSHSAEKGHCSRGEEERRSTLNVAEAYINDINNDDNKQMVYQRLAAAPHAE